MNGKDVTGLEEGRQDLCHVKYHHSLEGLRGKLRTVDKLPMIKTGYLTNTCIECDRYTKLLGPNWHHSVYIFFYF
jgi:hypothetical protein